MQTLTGSGRPKVTYSRAAFKYGETVQLRLDAFGKDGRKYSYGVVVSPRLLTFSLLLQTLRRARAELLKAL